MGRKRNTRVPFISLPKAWVLISISNSRINETRQYTFAHRCGSLLRIGDEVYYKLNCVSLQKMLKSVNVKVSL